MSETDLEMELKAWRLLLEDDAYRLDFPEDYYDTLIRRADELVLHELISLEDWQLLKDAADQAYQLTVEMLSRNQRDCLNVARMRLPRG
ncbi:hypothetical protein [Pseudomonas brassicacearum]|uniref:Uncharacterized protein n=1 Tax=Pseudomonas brassicacearum subsp. neoaurantiaca TaxID=494916 RepID=A0A7V8RKB4_9PSED|nr:hypothetical protein [Pseudomonas brassicacearum]MBA1377987.1 hypothetical protein [Pseudomonas brassicacearum subsp. neoaurantiaca]